MLKFPFADLVPPIRHVLCLGAHCDDIEIGCGGTVLKLAESTSPPEFTWVVFASDATREAEARQSADRFLRGAKARIIFGELRDGFLPHDGALVKEAFEHLKGLSPPDLVLTHYGKDLHQDHRMVSELSWSTFRDHLILEYEIPKYDGDLGAPNLFVPLEDDLCQRKIDIVLSSFTSQASKRWFTAEVFRSLLRLRGMECNAASNYAEAFYCRKLVAG
jgi:LmbE family N-acetylglucosaminyl deacetylase